MGGQYVCGRCKEQFPTIHAKNNHRCGKPVDENPHQPDASGIRRLTVRFALLVSARLPRPVLLLA